MMILDLVGAALRSQLVASSTHSFLQDRQWCSFFISHCNMHLWQLKHPLERRQSTFCII